LISLFAELADIPFGTGSLYVQDEKNSRFLVKENRCLNSTEREEATVTQYLVLGGHSTYTGLESTRRPNAVMSNIHAGPGQIVFGYSNKQYCDLAMAFYRDETTEKETDVPRSRLFFHNYHGYPWHYKGHSSGCPSTQNAYLSFELTPETKLMDDFRRRYAFAMTCVRPAQVTFAYHTSLSCDWFHDRPLPSLDPVKAAEGKFYYNINELLAEERSKEYYEPPSPTQKFFDKTKLVEDIAAGKIDGFVTLKGGRERSANGNNPASRHFGFCVQNYAPTVDQVSDYTKAQIAEFYGLDEDGVKKFLEKQPARTLNSTTFHSEETVSTAYLRWLMKERGFVDFEVTHFLWYKFNDHPRQFIEPLLQLRHRLKQEGNVAAAEALKLIVNSDYG
jgi:hypothetical protein